MEQLILIVDDDKVDRLTVRELMGKDYTLTEARSDEEARQVLLSSHVDCVLLDYFIPGTDSFSLLAECVGKNVPVVMLTGEGSEEIAVRAMKQGAQDYILKGNLNEALLKRTVGNAIHSVTLKRELSGKQEELLEVNNRLLEKVDELERVNGDLESFIHMAAHDLREPVKTIYNYCDLLSRRNTGSEQFEVKDLISTIQGNARRLASLIDDLRVLTKIGYGRAQRDSFSLRELVEEVLIDFKRKIEECGVTVKFTELPTVRAYRSLVAEVYRNLIGNALKYGCAEGLIIQITAEQQEGRRILGVKNNGSYISAEDRERVFKPFARLLNTQDRDGTGLGLTLCRRLIERHGGKIWIEETGSDEVYFRFTLEGGADESKTAG